MNTPNLGEKLRTLRTINKMTQAEFAAEIGVDSVHISKVERGKRGLGYDKIERVCKRFSIRIDDLLAVDEESEKEKRAKLIGEIVEELGRLNTSQLRVVKSSISTLN